MRTKVPPERGRISRGCGWSLTKARCVKASQSYLIEISDVGAEANLGGKVDTSVDMMAEGCG